MPRSESIHPAYHELRMKQEAAFFEGKNPVLIYIAKKLKEALRLEDALAEAGIDYGVEADEYRGGVVFRSVLDEQRPVARRCRRPFWLTG